MKKGVVKEPIDVLLVWLHFNLFFVVVVLFIYFFKE